MNDLKSLFQHEIQDLVSAEDQIIEALPQMIEKARNPELKKALRQHLEITNKQRKRLDRVLEMTKGEADEKGGFFSNLFDKIQGQQKCKGIEGIITEGQKIMGADMSSEVMDAAIIASAQKVEHYEICGYGTVKAYAQQLNLKGAVQLLEETLNEEYEADDILTRLAVGDVNERAQRGAVRGGRDSKGSSIKHSSQKAVSKSSTGNNKKAAAKSSGGKKAVAAKQSGGGKKAAAKSSSPKKAATKASSGGNKAAAKRGR